MASVARQAHVETSRTCLAVRRWIEEERLSAFTVNFLEVTQASGLPAVPFLEASKAMTRGIGYAGEGDVCDELARFGRIRGWRVTVLEEPRGGVPAAGGGYCRRSKRKQCLKR